MPYSTITLNAARQALSDRLVDPDLIRWPAAELDGYVREALRTFNAYTASYRNRGVFSLQSQEPFYDLPTVLPALRGQTLTNYDLQADIARALLETVPTTTWTGTLQFTLSDVTQAITRRRDQFLRETGAVLTRHVTTITPAPAGRHVLPVNTLRVRRAAWRSSSGSITPLILTDEWGADHYQSAWPQTNTRPPAAYSVSTTPPLRIQVMPPPLDTGALDLLTIDAGGSLDPDEERLLGIPNDWAWVVKWGALADLLGRDGLALDPGRAAYCEARWAQGIQAASTAPVILGGRINNKTLTIGGILDADKYSPTWQTVPGVPRNLLTSGQTTVAAWPPPGVPIQGGTWSATLDVVANIPVPVNGTDCLQVDVGQYDGLLDYAQHLALFKEGPQELLTSQALLDRFLSMCGVTVKFQQGSQPARAPMTQQQQQDDHSQPAAVTPVGV